jgi:hypothetical protein
MKKVFENNFCIVFDDLLNSQNFEELWNFFQNERFQFIMSDEWIKVNRLTDGNSLYGSARFSKKKDEIPLQFVFPFSDPFDIFFRVIYSLIPKINKVVGKEHSNWKLFTARPYIYPKGAGLSWHNDDCGYTGAYVYYIHPYWNSQWGGELLIGDRTAFNIKYGKQKKIPNFNESFAGYHLYNTMESEQLFKSGIGTYILPKSNRIVFLKAGIHHMIKKVEDSAGDHARCSIAGFFIK